MAISPETNKFLQKDSENRVEKIITNFGLRTGQRFPFIEKGIAKGKVLEQQLETEQADKVQQSRTALALRQQEEENRRFDVSTDLELQKQRTAKKAEKQKRRDDLNNAIFGKTVGPVVSAIS